MTGVGLTLDDLPDYDEQPRIDPRMWFDRGEGDDPLGHPFELEIGSGKGTFLVQQAPLEPDVNFLGIEWAGEFYRYAADRIRRHGLSNVRMLRADAVEFICFRVPDSICRVLHVYFPDPWPKKRHHKRRTIQEKHLAEFHRILEPGGELRLVTDHPDYWAWMVQHVVRVAHLFTRESFDRPESVREGEIVGTNFERKYRREGRPFYAMVLRAIAAEGTSPPRPPSASASASAGT